MGEHRQWTGRRGVAGWTLPFSVVLVVLLLAACNDLWGLDELRYGVTPGGFADAGEGGAAGAAGAAGTGGVGAAGGAGLGGMGTTGGGAGGLCGNAVLEAGEACDDGNVGGGDGCSGACEIELGFECEGTPSSCTTECGDAIVAGEEVCDDGNTESGDLCASDCLSGFALLFDDDMESGPGGWTHQLVDQSAGFSDNWSLATQRFHSASHAWASGPTLGTEGSTRLVSPTIDLSAVPQDSTVTATFWQFYHYDDCGSPSTPRDGHVIELSADGASFVRVTPNEGYPGQLGGCDNPLTGLGYSSDSGQAFVQASVDLSGWIGSAVRIGWRQGLDCGNCSSEEGLYVDDVQVVASL